MIKNFTRLALIALFLAWVFDQLFWDKLPGVSFPLFVLLTLAAGFFLAWREGIKPARSSLVLLVPIGFFAGMSFFRLEPFTQLLNYGLTLALMALLTVTFAGGRWLFYTLVDYSLNLLSLIPSLMALPVVGWDRSRLEAAKSSLPDNKASGGWRAGLAVVRGIALALPVLFFFTALLAAADPAFSAEVENLLSFFRIEKLPEYLFRLCYIVAMAYCLIAIYLHAFTHSPSERASAGQSNRLRRLPFTETAIVLGSVNVLFAAFVIVQVRYFFGGNANIHVAGYTYAEYARRGFGELVIVAFFSLLLFQALNLLSRRETPPQRWSFSALGSCLALLVIVILVSAFQRLTLYEQAYGFTRLRLYTHVFMFWLGLLLVAMVILEWMGRLHHFALAALIAVVGFAATLDLINVDAMIVRQNLAHNITQVSTSPRRSANLDSTYLARLTTDAVPALVEAFHQGDYPPEVHDKLGAALACQAAQFTAQPPLPWPSFHGSHYRAAQLLQAEQSNLGNYPVSTEQGSLWVQINGNSEPCFEYSPEIR